MLPVMTATTIAPALPAIEKNFASVENVEVLVRLILTIPSIFVALGSPLAGIIIDRQPRKPFLIFTLVIFGLAGISGLFLDSLQLILVGRGLLGLSVAGVITVNTTLIADYYQDNTRAKLLGLKASVLAIASVIFTILTGFLVDINWRLPFISYLVSFLLIPLVVVFLPEVEKSSSSPSKINHLDTFEFPIKNIFITYSIVLLNQIVYFFILLNLPFYLQKVVSSGGITSGLFLGIFNITMAIASISYGWIKKGVSFIKIYAFGFLCLGIGYILIILSNDLIILGLAIAGMGRGLIMPNTNVYLAYAAPFHLRGFLLGGLVTSAFLGNFISVFINQFLVEINGIENTFLFTGIFMLVCFGITLVFSRFNQSSL